MEAGRRKASQKQLAPNQRVSGAVRDFIEGPEKKMSPTATIGYIIQAVGEG